MWRWIWTLIYFWFCSSSGTDLGLVMWLTIKLIAWVEKYPEKDLLVMGVGIAIAVAVAVFAAVKPYPADYNEAGELLVDGTKIPILMLWPFLPVPFS